MFIREWFSDLSFQVKFTIIIVIFAAVIGVPLTYNSFVWSAFKTSKQNVNCISGLYSQVSSVSPYSPDSGENAMKAGQVFFECQNNVDPHKSTIRFLREDMS